MKRWFRVDLNPYPWAVGPIQRKGQKGVFMGKNQGLAAFQEGVRNQFPEDTEKIEGLFRLRLWFYRRIDQYELDNKKSKNQEADVTNMQKAFEDALHKVFYDDDVNDRDVHSTLVYQDDIQEGMIIGYVEPIDQLDILETLKEIPNWLFKDPNQPFLEFGPDYNKNTRRN